MAEKIDSKDNKKKHKKSGTTIQKCMVVYFFIILGEKLTFLFWATYFSIYMTLDIFI